MGQYFNTAGVTSEQDLYESLIIESIDFWGNNLYYIPRTIVAKDGIFGEDRLSEFKNKYLIRGYWENIDQFGGQGAFIQKFGLQIEQTGTLTIARKAWDQAVGKYGTSILSNRPAEGDLIYWPLTDGLFEIKFVQHENPFYQIGRLYVYKLEVELFQYASERIDTGMEAIDAFEDLKSLDVSITSDPTPVVPQLPVNAGDNQKFRDAAPSIGFTTDNIFGDPT